MPRTVTQIRVFVASPGDVPDERDALDEVVDDLRHSFDDLDVRLLRWERDTYPAMGRPQGVVNDQVGEFDVFVGVMWKRFGTRTGEADSGTEEEFNRAFERWQQTGRPPILFYFCERPFFPRSDEEIRQFDKVRAFRSRLEGSGLVGTYTEVDEFKRKVRRALDRVLRDEATGVGSTPPEGAGVEAATVESGAAPPHTPQPEPRRFSDIPLPRRRAQVTDLDKHRFVHDGFCTIVSYFEDAAEALREADPALDVEIEKESSRAFRASVFEGGQARSRCRIWIRDDFGSDGIAYVAGGGFDAFSGNSMNDYVDVAEMDEGLAFSLSGMDFSTQIGQIVDPEGAAHHFWTRFTRPLDNASRS